MSVVDYDNVSGMLLLIYIYATDSYSRPAGSPPIYSKISNSKISENPGKLYFEIMEYHL